MLSLRALSMIAANSLGGHRKRQGSPARKEDGERVPVGTRKPPAGRNQPCPCKSGKKFKKCCMPGLYRPKKVSKSYVVSPEREMQQLSEAPFLGGSQSVGPENPAGPIAQQERELPVS